MVKGYTNEYIAEIIQSVMKLVKIDLEIRPDHSGINMSYNFIGHYIGIDFNRLRSAWEEIEVSISFKSYIKVLTIHELGHAIDRPALLESLERTIEIFEIKKNYLASEIYKDSSLLAVIIEDHEMNIIFEETAWINAEQLKNTNNLVNNSNFALVKDISLESYQRLYLKDLELYNTLLENLNYQTA